MTLAAEFTLNLVLSGLLAMTVMFCWVLNRRIKVLQDGKGELAALLARFDGATARAAEITQTLHTSTKKIETQMHARIERAQYAMDDLNLLIDRAEKIADKLEAGTNPRNRPAAPRPAPSAPPLQVAPKKEEAARQDDEESSRAIASLQAMLQKIVSEERADSPRTREATPAPPKPLSRPRSQAEEELLQMIRNRQ